MTDINISSPAITETAPPAPAAAALSGAQDLREGVELLFFAYRDFTANPDALLAARGLGRAHHRVLYFVGRQPGMTVTELLGVLRITRQSLNRILGRLLREGYIRQRPGARDRRRRLLELTEAGRRLEDALGADQRQRIARAYRHAGADAVAGFRRVMRALLSAESAAALGQGGQHDG